MTSTNFFARKIYVHNQHKRTKSKQSIKTKLLKTLNTKLKSFENEITKLALKTLSHLVLWFPFQELIARKLEF